MQRRRLLIVLLMLMMVSGCDGSGDRVLVGKFLYDTDVVPPNRYDVVVFKFPEEPIKDGTPKNYIKRLIGLPGQIIAIFFGRLYGYHHTGSGAPEGITEEEWHDLTTTANKDPLDLWKSPPRNHPTAEKLWKEGRFEILRKPPHVMLALSRPVYDNDFQAKDLVNVLPERWAAARPSNWVADDAKGFKTAGTGNAEDYLHYRHIVRPNDWPASTDPGRDAKIKEIKERTHSPQLITDVLGYNTYEPHFSMASGSNWVGDLMLDCKLTVIEPKGEFRMELSRGVDRFQARFDLATGVCSLYRLSEHKTKQEKGVDTQVPDWQELSSSPPTRLKVKGDYLLRFANYDDRLTVWIDGDLPFGDGKSYAPPANLGPDTYQPAEGAAFVDALLAGTPNTNNDLQPASLCSVGAAVSVHDLNLWRDTYYTGSGDHNWPDMMPPVRGEDLKNPREWHKLNYVSPLSYYVYPGHYFCLGDNSPESSDSRFWNGQVGGLVPQRLMLGRALLVYFPFERAGTIK